jgi:hypothetical protein
VSGNPSPLLPSPVVEDAPPLSRGTLPGRPSSRVIRTERLPVLRQIQSLTSKRLSFPVAFQAFVRAHFGHPIRHDNACTEPLQAP